MLKDASQNAFSSIYLLYGLTSLRYGIDSITAIFKKQDKISFFVPNTIFFAVVALL